ncbi:hypothetical protein WMO18_03530 [Ruminococcoides sp. CLA-AA-H171]|jgi:hypothetical protein|uniref:Leucine-rich repeat domain-containing protein n=1 Tax=Ruminococcoides intestinihominis TaxID=3133161 RepID=A0ABV1HVC3_9FIRM
MGYNLINWENSPSKQTPINAENLNQMDENIAKAIQGTRFNFSATFTADNVLKNTTSTKALGAGSFATSQTDIVTVFVADNVTKINSGTFSGCTSLKTIYIDNTVGNVEIVSGSVPSGVSIVYSNDGNFINVNELLASAIRSLKSSVNTNRTDWENRATSIEAQHKTDVQTLNANISQVADNLQIVKETAQREIATTNTNVNGKESLSNKVDVITHPSTTTYPSVKGVWDFVETKSEQPRADIAQNKADIVVLKVDKVDNTDFNAYKTSNDTAVKQNATDIVQLKADVLQNAIKVTTDKSTSIVLNDSSDCNIVGLTLYGKSTQSAIPTPTNPVDINNINNPSITFSNDSDRQSNNIQCTLRGIGNVCDTLTVNSDGTGYITQRLFVERITSQRKSTSLEWNYSKATHRFFRNDYSYSFDVKDNKPLILCSHLDVGENEKNTAFDNSIGWINVSGVGIAIRMTELDGDIAKFKKWLDDNEVYVVAPRSKPITVNLSKDEVDKIISLHTYYPNTTIIADCDCQVEYVADTKNYIDNKIIEVATALVAHESEVM